MKKAAWVVAAGVLVCGLAVFGFESLQAAETAKSAEEAGWELAFEDDFDRDELGDDWTVIDGKWEIKDGCLRGSGNIVSTKGIPGEEPSGFQRIEFEAATDVKTIALLKNAPPPKAIVSDLSCFLHVEPPKEDKSVPKSGYFFQFGGFNNTKNSLRRNGTLIKQEKDPEIRITPEKKHKIVAENDEGNLRLYVDGEKIFDHKEEMSIMGTGHDHVGLYFYTAARVFNLKVYLKRLPDGLDLE